MALETIIRDTPSVQCRLRLVRRHSKNCIDPQTGKKTSESIDCPRKPAHKKCKLWVKGTYNDEDIEIPLNTRTLSVAIERINEKIEADDITRGISIKQAVDDYLKEKIKALVEGGKELSIEQGISTSDTIRKYNDLLSQFKTFCDDREIRFLSDVKLKDLEEFRDSWKGRFDNKTKTYRPKSLTGRQKYQETLKSFFRHCHDRGFIRVNPAALLSKIKNTDGMARTPHEPEDIARMLSLIDETFPKIGNMVRAFLLVMASTGLRIGDVATLETASVQGDKIFLGMEKTNKPLHTRLPPMAVEALKSFKPKSKKYFFWTGNGKIDTIKADWSEKLLKLYRAADTNLRSHAFRDTITTTVLGSGGKMETASALLGHDNIRITQRHYEHWSSERQEILDKDLHTAWAKLGLTDEVPSVTEMPVDIMEKLDQLLQAGKGDKLRAFLALI